MAGEDPTDLTYIGETANKFLSRCVLGDIKDDQLTNLLNISMPSLGKAHNSHLGLHVKYNGFNYEKVLPDIGMHEDEKLTPLFTNYRKYYYGFHAACRMLHHIVNGLIRVTPDIKYVETQALFKGLVTFYQESTFIAKSEWDISTKESEIEQQILRVERFAEGIRRLIHAGNAPAYRNHEGWVDPFSDKLPELTSFIHIPKSAFSVYKLKDLLVFASNKLHGIESEVVVLSFKDQTKLLYMLEALSKWMEYGKGLATTYGLGIDLCKLYSDWILESLNRCPSHLINSFCKQLKVFHTWLVARFLGSLSSDIAIRQRVKFNEGEWRDVFKDEQLLLDIVKLPLVASLGISQIYRIFATPDVDEIQSLNELKAYHLNPRTLPEDNDSKLMRNMVWQYVDRQLMISVRKWAGTYPGKPRSELDEDSPDWLKKAAAGEKTDVPLDFQELWDIDGSMPYSSRSSTYYELVKDKACTYDGIEGIANAVEYSKLQPQDTNSLVKLLLSDKAIDLDKVKDDILTKNLNTSVKVAIKNEKHKPLGRPFFIQKEQYKLVLSELEENIERVAHYVPGFGISQGGVKFLEKVRKMSGQEVSSVGFRPFCLSFDLEKFSPRMSPITRDRMYKRWARLFGQPWISNLSDITGKANIRFMNFRTNFAYTSIGNDFEGMNAKQNTEFHPAIMATGIRWLRQHEKEKTSGIPPASFDCFIDDGALVILFPEKHYDYLKTTFLDILDRVYKSVGWEISWEKTYLSDIGFVYLNRIFAHGKEVQTGIKAFMKIAVVHENSVESIVDRLESLKGRFQGALESGSPPTATYWTYFREFIKELRRWDRAIPLDSLSTLPLLIAPIGFGGFGLASLFASTTNIGESNTSLSVDFLYATKNTELLSLADKILAKEIRIKDAIDVFRNPKTITIQGAYLKSARMISEAQKVVLSVVKNPLLCDLFSAVDYNNTTKLCEDLLKNMEGGIALPLIEKIWESFPEKYLEEFLSKFKRSRSIAALLSRDIIQKIRNQNKNDVKNVVLSYYAHV